MKRFITILFVLLISSVALGKSREQVEMEKMLSQTVKVNTTNGFKVYKTITLADEVKEELDLHNWKLRWEQSFYNEFKDIKGNGYQDLAADSAGKITKETDIIKYLEGIEYTHLDSYNETTYTIYQLSYWYNDSQDRETFNVCFGRFDAAGNLVAFRPTGKSDWQILGNTCSIPGYNK